MITKRDFIFTGMQPWDIPIGSNAKDIALEISKHNRVLYVNTPLDTKTLWQGENTPEFHQRKNVINGKSEALRQINQNLWVLDYPFSILPTHFLPDGYLFDVFNRKNNKRMYEFVCDILKKMKFEEYILFIDNDIYRSFYAVDFLHPAFSIYYRRDNMKSTFWQKHAPRLEPLLCQKSNLVVANSSQLAEAVRKYNVHSYDVGQGVDLTNYKIDMAYPIPNDMKSIQKPIIGYVGWVTSRRLDADLMYDIAEGCPSYSFVIVGGEDEVFKNHKIHSLNNVYFLGQKEQIETIAYIAHFDVCINPQKINEITIGNYPRKVDEYLALGKPVVATRTQTMEIFADYAWNCMGVKEFIQGIKKALEQNDPQIINQRIQFAHTHTWHNSVNRIYNYINNIDSYA